MAPIPALPTPSIPNQELDPPQEDGHRPSYATTRLRNFNPPPPRGGRQPRSSCHCAEGGGPPGKKRADKQRANASGVRRSDPAAGKGRGRSSVGLGRGSPAAELTDPLPGCLPRCPRRPVGGQPPSRLLPALRSGGPGLEAALGALRRRSGLEGAARVYTASIVERKNEICRLHETINSSNDAIVYLHKHNKNSKDNCNVWKPTYVVLSKHEEYLHNQLKNCQETTENDKKIYQDHMNQYKEILKQHKAKYSENCLAQEYYVKKKEIEELRNRVLKHSEQFKWKEATLLDILEPAPFRSLSDWALQIAYLRQKTQDIFKHAAVFTQKSSELEKEADEVEMKINYFQQKFNETAGANNPKIAKVPSRASLQNQMQFRLLVPQEQTTCKQWFENEATVIGCAGPAPKSPAFSFLMPCTQKSPGFNLFDSSVFGAENSSGQTDESYSAGNVNPISPHKDIGSLFGKSENEDAFTFSFSSELSSHEYGDRKDDFSFPFAFGQDQRSSHSSPLKGFHSSSQNTKPFTLF
ncbi:protein SIX6OS1 [Pangshura tecta]